MSGEAMRMKLQLAAYRREPAPFTPLPLLAPVDHDVIVEGYAAPATVDREFMKFASYCWFPLPKQVPLLVRHDSSRPAGKVLEAHTDDKGLYVKALVTDAEAKRYSHFSVAATIRAYRLRDADDPVKAHAIVISAVLDEVSIVRSAANPDARILLRDRPTPTLETYDLAKAGITKLMEMVETLQAFNRAQPAPPAQTLRPKVKTCPAVEPHRATPFGKLITAIEERAQ